MNPILSILICTVDARYDIRQRLEKKLLSQMDYSKVEVVVDADNERSIGSKRENLKHCANGDYIVYIDDDDHISRNYIRNILEALETKPDAVGIQGMYTHDGKNRMKLVCSSHHNSWDFSKERALLRPINHLNPVRKEIAIRSKFPDISYGEDRFYSEGLKPFIKTEVMAKGFIYWYDYRPHHSLSILKDIKEEGRGLKMLNRYQM